jgi:DNA-binding LacI/PurR family transcriptional regulator
MRRGAGRSTLTGIAAEAGVSVSTVSKVLNGRTDVAPRTRTRLTELLRGYGYQVAAGQRSGVVDLLIGSLHGPWAEELIRGAVDAAREAGHSIVVTMVDAPAEFGPWLDRATERGTDGVLSVLYLPDGAERHRLAAAHIPLGPSAPPTGRAAWPRPATWLSSVTAGSPRSAGRSASGLRTPGWTATGPR